MLLEEVYRLEREKKASIIPGIYSFLWDTSVLTAGITLGRSVNIQSDSHFISRYVNIATYAAGPVLATATDPLELQLTDTGSGRFLFDDFVPKFVKPYAHLKADALQALKSYKEEVDQGKFPSDSESYH